MTEKINLINEITEIINDNDIPINELIKMKDTLVKCLPPKLLNVTIRYHKTGNNKVDNEISATIMKALKMKTIDDVPTNEVICIVGSELKSREEVERELKKLVYKVDIIRIE